MIDLKFKTSPDLLNFAEDLGFRLLLQKYCMQYFPSCFSIEEERKSKERKFSVQLLE